MAARRQYTEEDKAVALAAYAANENNLTRTAAFCKIPKQTLHFWVKGGAVNPAVSESSDLKKEELSDRLEAIAHKLVDAMPDKIEEATLQQVATSLGIAVDKMQLLRSKPTEIIEDASLSDAERAERINAILDKARARRAEQPGGAGAEGAE